MLLFNSATLTLLFATAEFIKAAPLLFAVLFSEFDGPRMRSILALLSYSEVASVLTSSVLTFIAVCNVIVI